MHNCAMGGGLTELWVWMVVRPRQSILCTELSSRGDEWLVCLHNKPMACLENDYSQLPSDTSFNSATHICLLLYDVSSLTLSGRQRKYAAWCCCLPVVRVFVAGLHQPTCQGPHDTGHQGFAGCAASAADEHDWPGMFCCWSRHAATRASVGWALCRA